VKTERKVGEDYQRRLLEAAESVEMSLMFERVGLSQKVGRNR
jgi:hypothetical protein